MPNQRKKGKKLVGFFATEEEAAALLDRAKQEGLTVADWIRKQIRDAAPSTPLPKSSSSASKKIK